MSKPIHPCMDEDTLRRVQGSLDEAELVRNSPGKLRAIANEVRRSMDFIEVRRLTNHCLNCQMHDFEHVEIKSRASIIRHFCTTGLFTVSSNTRCSYHIKEKENG